MKVYIIIYDAYGDRWVDAVYYNETEAKKHLASGCEYEMEKMVMSSKFARRPYTGATNDDKD